MTPDVVVDVGNTRIKWGRCAAGRVAQVIRLPPEPVAWEEPFASWTEGGSLTWILTGVHPARRTALAAWLRERGQQVRVIEDWRELGLTVALEHPERAGIDRLLDAVAVNERREPGRAAVVVDAGSAVTVNLVDAAGTFRGGSIAPGLRLMARALKDHTALLPLIEIQTPQPPSLGLSTPQAMAAGIYWSVVGGIRTLYEELSRGLTPQPELWLTGGDGPLLAPALEAARTWPEMTLEGVRLTAARLS